MAADLPDRVRIFLAIFKTRFDQVFMKGFLKWGAINVSLMSGRLSRMVASMCVALILVYTRIDGSC